jgi:hypothetical protein
MRRIGVVIVILAFVHVAGAQQLRPPHHPPPPPPPPPPCKATANHPCEKTIDITDPLSIGGKLRTLSMLGFLERATEELERASLEKKSFVPKLVQTVDEAAL